MGGPAATRAVGDLPGPRGLPLFGNLHQTWRLPRSHQVVERWAERYGPIFRFRVGSRLVVVVSDEDEVNRILRERPEGYRRWPEVEDAFGEIGFLGVFSVEGDTWRRQRRLAVTALNFNHLHRRFDAIRTAADRLRGRLQEIAADGEPIDPGLLFASYTLDVTSMLAFGHDLDAQRGDDSDLQLHIQRAFRMLSFRLFFPLRYWRRVKLPADRRLDRSVDYLREAVGNFIGEARERMARRPELFEEPGNFLEAMLGAQREDDAYSDEEIAGNVFGLMLAGEDTTAQTLTWAAWSLAGHPEVRRRLAAEADAVLDGKPVPGDPEEVARLTYCDAVLRETLRLKSVVNGMTLQALVDTTVLGTAVPAGTRLLTAFRSVGRAAGGPEFRPGRWLAAEEAPGQKSFLAFGAGPRFCPGRNLAMLEAKSALATIARDFELELDPDAGEVRERFAFMVIPEGLRIRVRERRPEGGPQPVPTIVTTKEEMRDG
jgi:cytochrome P450